MLPKKAATAIAPGKPKGKLKGKAKPPTPAPAGAPQAQPATPKPPMLKAGASKKLKGMS